MHATHVLLGLVATVSAVDILGYRSNKQCKGNDYIACTNVNPGDCCIRASGDIFQSVGFRAIPTYWNVAGQGYKGGDCKNLQYVAASNGAENVCAGGNNYSGGQYVFSGKKRSIGPAAETCPAPGGCTSVRRGDLMVFANGVKYNLTNLNDDLLDHFSNGSNATDIPAKFDAYKAE